MGARTNVAANLQTLFSYMTQAASNGVDLVVFPEIVLQQCPAWGHSSHTPTVQEMAYVRQTAETIPGQSTSNIVVKAKELNCTDPANPFWSPLRTNTLTDGWSYFSDPQWSNHPARFHRLRSP